MWITWGAKLMALWSHHHNWHVHNCKCSNTLIFFFSFSPLPRRYFSFSLFTMFSTILPLVFFSPLGYSLNSYWFNFFFIISRPITWVVRRRTYEAFQPSMHVNNIQVGRQSFLVILQSFHHVFYLSFSK